LTFINDLKNEFNIFSFIGGEYFSGFSMTSPMSYTKATFREINNLLLEKYTDHLLFDYMTQTYYFYDEEFPGANSFLTVQKFKHSTIFEFV